MKKFGFLKPLLLICVLIWAFAEGEIQYDIKKGKHVEDQKQLFAPAPQSSAKIEKELQKNLEQAKSSDEKFKCSFLLASFYRDNQNYLSAEKYFEYALALEPQNASKKNLARDSNNLGLTYFLDGQVQTSDTKRKQLFAKSASYFLEALKLCNSDPTIDVDTKKLISNNYQDLLSEDKSQPL